MPIPFGNYPFTPDKKRCFHLRRADMKRFVYTTALPESSDLNRLVVSTDTMTVAEYQVAPGSTFDPTDVHPGDEIYYILHGTLTITNPHTGQALEVSAGECAMIPKGTPHKAYNFTDDYLNIMFVIAPKIWDDGPPLEYDGDFLTYQVLKER